MRFSGLCSRWGTACITALVWGAGCLLVQGQTAGNNEWAWIAGSNTGAQTPGVYGQLALPAPANTPGERMSTVNWTDTEGNLWLFGNNPGTDAAGKVGFLDDVWEFNTAFQQWIWMAGSSKLPASGTYGWSGLPAVPPVFGTYQTPAAGTTPGALQNPQQWTDKQGNLWLFGGTEYRIINFKTNSITLGALWKFDVATHQWAWMGGSSNESGTAPGVYGTLGQADPANTPGGRTGAVTWTDGSGRLWLFGGNGFDAAGVQRWLNDLWMFDPTTLEWTWIAGSDRLPAQGGAPAVFGTLGVPAAGNTPPGLQASFVWTDQGGSVWLFGGSDSIVYNTGTGSQVESTYSNDLWKFDASTHQWAWMGGSGTLDGDPLPGVYGTRGKPSPTNLPGGRAHGNGYSWIDSSGKLWLFGGSGYDSTSDTAELNDLWEFDRSTDQWTWMGGPAHFQTVSGPNGTQQLCESGSLSCAVPGVYGVLATPAAGNIPGTRLGASLWTDKSGDVWLFGGWGVDSVGTWGDLNDLWKFDSSVNEWAWMGGSSTVPQNSRNSGGLLGNYGSFRVFSATNAPGSHQPAAAWTHDDGNLWMFGGTGCNQEKLLQPAKRPVGIRDLRPRGAAAGFRARHWFQLAHRGGGQQRHIHSIHRRCKRV